MPSAGNQLQEGVSGNSHARILEESREQRRCTSIAKM
jgi:hypothetical protein